MADFTNDSEKVLAKAQELMDKKSHSYLGVVHLAHGLLEAPDARLKNLYRAKKANIKEMQAKLAPFLDSVPKLMDVNPDAGRPDEDLSRVLRAAIQAGRKTSQAASPSDMLVALMRFAQERRVAKIFEDALGSAEVVETWLSDPMSAAAVAEEESPLKLYGRELVSLAYLTVSFTGQSVPQLATSPSRSEYTSASGPAMRCTPVANTSFPKGRSNQTSTCASRWPA